MKIINIKNKKEALEVLERYKNKEQSGAEIKLINVHLCKINDLVGEKIFSKNDLYVMGETLYEIMQPVGVKGRHNHNSHGLSPASVLNVLNSASAPIGIYSSTSNRFVIVTIVLHQSHDNLILVVERNASLKNNRDARINKLVSIYPKRNVLQKIKR